MAENGVLKYDKYMVPIFFEADHVDCLHCPFLETYSRNQCRRTGEYVLDTRGRGYWCPLIKIDDMEDDDEGNSEAESG